MANKRSWVEGLTYALSSVNQALAGIRQDRYRGQVEARQNKLADAQLAALSERSAAAKSPTAILNNQFDALNLDSGGRVAASRALTAAEHDPNTAIASLQDQLESLTKSEETWDFDQMNSAELFKEQQKNKSDVQGAIAALEMFRDSGIDFGARQNALKAVGGGSTVQNVPLDEQDQGAADLLESMRQLTKQELNPMQIRALRQTQRNRVPISGPPVNETFAPQMGKGNMGPPWLGPNGNR
jgi:hypothetical protein